MKWGWQRLLAIDKRGIRIVEESGWPASTTTTRFMGSACQRGFGGSAAASGFSNLEKRMLASPHCWVGPGGPRVTAPALSTPIKASKKGTRFIARRNEAAIAITAPRFVDLRESQ